MPTNAEIERDLRLSSAETGADYVDTEEVWVSSRAHLNQFNSILKSTPAGSQATAGFVVPAGYPYTYTTLPWIRTPLPWYARGTMRIGSNELAFRAVNRPQSFMGKQVRFYNLSDDLTLRVARPDIHHVVWYTYESPIGSDYNLPWISLALNGEEMLLIAGEFGLGTTSANVRDRTRRLYADLIRFVGRNGSN